MIGVGNEKATTVIVAPEAEKRTDWCCALIAAPSRVALSALAVDFGGSNGSSIMRSKLCRGLIASLALALMMGFGVNRTLMAQEKIDEPVKPGVDVVVGQPNKPGPQGLTLSAVAARPSVLDQVPPDALIVMKINDLQRANTRVGDLMKRLGADKMNPEVADPMNMVLNEFGITKGFDKNGQAALYMTNAEVEHGEPTVFLISVTDYAAFLGNFADPKKEGDIDVFTARDSTCYAKQWGTYAAIARDPELLKTKKHGLDIRGKATAAMLADPTVDLAFFANAPVLVAAALPELLKSRAKTVDEVVKAFEENKGDKRFTPVIKALVNTGLNMAEETLKDGEAAAWSLTLDEKGAKAKLVADFAPETYLGKKIASLKNTDESLLKGLPADGDFVYYYGIKSDRQFVGQLFDDLTADVKKELPNVGEDGKRLMALIDAERKLLTSIDDGAAGITFDATAAQGGALKLLAIVHGDSKALVQAANDATVGMQEFEKLIDGSAAKPSTETSTKTVDGVELTKSDTVVEVDPNDPTSAMAGQAMGVLFGGTKISQFIGRVDDNTMVQLLGDDEAYIKAGIAAAKANADDLVKKENVAEVADALPKQRLFAAYFAVDKLVVNGSKMMAQFGVGPPKIDLPPNLPPIGMTVGTEGSAIRIDGYLPYQLIESITAAFLQAQQNPQHNQGRGGDL